MKRLLTLAAFCLVFASVSANAKTTGYLSCTNGDVDKVGDSYFQVDLLEDGIEFQQYESSFTLDAADVQYNGGSYAIVNKTVTATAEGDELQVTINAMLVASENDTKLSLALSYDYGPFQTYELTCVKK